MTSRPSARGTIEWFKHERLHLVEHAKAVDSFGAAARSFQRLVELGVTADDQVRSALHTAGVVEYARPFSRNKTGKGDFEFAKSIIKDHPRYSEEIHQQLVTLRQKLIAHSDRDYADGRLFRKLFSLDIKRDGQTERGEVFAGVCLVTQTVHALNDVTLAERYLAHVLAAEDAAHTILLKRLEDFALAGREFPDQIKAAAPPESKRIILGDRFELSPDAQEVRLPNTVLNPHAVLSRPPLGFGLDGYAYRGFGVSGDLAGDVVRRDDDGTETTVFKLEVIGPPVGTATGSESDSSA
jgi:hypothetical protein